MLKVDYAEDILRTIKKIKDFSVKEKIKKQIKKVLEKPEIGKQVRYARKGTRELSIGSYRLTYSYFREEKK
jgi:mRNA-degrading endonuclease RelE of RelBE toxin-antitoxin system